MHGLCVMWTLLMVNTQNCMWTPKLSMLDWKSYWDGWIIAEWKRRPISNYTYCKSALDVGIVINKVWRSEHNFNTGTMPAYLNEESKLYDQLAEVSNHQIYHTSCYRRWPNVHIQLHNQHFHMIIWSLQAASWLPFANIFQFRVSVYYIKWQNK